MDLEFEWDRKKAEENLKTHGVSFEEAVTVFRDPLARIVDDPDHSQDERREIAVGHSGRRRLLLVSFVERQPRVRIISARSATRRERRDYEQSTKEKSQKPS